MKNIKFIIFITLLLSFTAVFSQEKKKKFENLEFSGYITNMQSFLFDSINNNWVNDNLLHNRLNFKWYVNEHFSTGIEIRNRIFTGETVEYTPGYAQMLENGKGLIDLSYNFLDKKSVIGNTEIDRFHLTYEIEKFKATAGRQRINWGRTFVWNPNDIFNNYSFFDFDYEEKPGTDAIRLEYFPTYTSSAELVASADSSKQISVAGLYKFNFKNYDIQLLSGIIKETDYFAGFGWEGAIKNVSFRGEASYIQAKEKFADTSGIFVATLSADYMFKNELMIQFEFLYNEQKSGQGINNFTDYYTQPASVKNLSFTEYNFFLNVMYPITPLLNITLSGMYYPKIKGYFISPSIAYSLSSKLDFSLIAQTFSGGFPNQFSGEISRQIFNMIFIRMKYNF